MTLGQPTCSSGLARASDPSSCRRGAISMLRTTLCSGAALALVLCASEASAAGLKVPNPASNSGAVVQKVHTVYEAEETLQRRGYYDVRLERASLPYSFNACKRGVRYHIHVDYYGDLVEVDAMGACYGSGNGYGNGYGSEYEDRGGRYRYRGSDYSGRVPYD